jgi:hypothetical protein
MFRQVSLTRVRIHLSVALAAALVALAFAGARADAAVVASNGFTAQANGYSFGNYGDGFRDLTPVEMVRLFGKRICSNGSARGCELTPEAQAWMEATNSDMSGGHCFGFATTSQLFFEGKGPFPHPAAFGAPTTPGLDIDGNPRLQSWIAYAWSLQTLPAVQQATTHMTPAGVVRELERKLSAGNAKYLLEIFDDGDGHAITPVAVDRAGSTAQIEVYDNNWPGQTRAVRVNLRKSTWSYKLAGDTTWNGTAKTRTLQLADPSAGLGHQPCFICAPNGRAGGPGKTLQLRLTGDPRSGRHGSMVVTDRRGNRAGFDRHGAFNRIRGVRMFQPTTGPRPWRTQAPPTIELPSRNSYEVELGDTARKGNVREDVRLIGRGFSVGADRIGIRKGERDRLHVARRARRVAFVNDARGVESPVIMLTASNLRGGRDFEIAIKPAGVNRGAAVSARLDRKRRRVVIRNVDGARVERVAVEVTVYTRNGSPTVTRSKRIHRGHGWTLKL